MPEEIRFNRDSYEYTNWNQSPEIYQENREPYRTTAVPFLTEAQALENLRKPIPERSYRKSSALVINLNATAEERLWKFHWAYSCQDKAIQTTPKADPRAFHGTEYRKEITWDAITVPMSWQVAETLDPETGLYRRLYDSPMYIGDGVIFENYDKPRDARTLRVDPDTASVGTYRRSFRIPEEWAGRECFLCFNGVANAFYTWVNGVYCGYGENRTAASSFRVTEALRPGETNEVVVEVYRNCTGIYMEDQDMTRMSGIFRDVYLYSADPDCSIRDFRAVPGFDASYQDAELSVRVYLHSYTGYDLRKVMVRAALYDSGTPVTEKTFAAADSRVLTSEELLASGDYVDFRCPQESELVLSNTLQVPAPRHWSDETPNLYDLVLTVTADGAVRESTGCKVGFRVLELQTAPGGRQYYTVNGRRIVLYGMNRHEHWYTTGSWISPEHQALELAQMKALNINSIRTSHYTCDPALYDYCDEFGIYLFAEANVETASDIDDPDAPINKGPSENDFEDGKSGPANIVGEEPPEPGDEPSQEEKDHAIAARLGQLEASEMQLRLEPALLDRQKANVIPNKNHPSVIIWSVCNEAGSGSPYLHMHEWIRRYEEEDRIIFYKAEYAGNTVSNLDYPSPAAIINYCEGKDLRPLIMSEYAHAEVQGRGGSSDSYVFDHDFAKDYISFLGMYVWSWKDQSFFAYGADTHIEARLQNDGIQRYLGYQGMWMDRLYGAQKGHFALGAFDCNGVVTGNNEYKPEAVDLKAAYSKIRVLDADLWSGMLKLENRHCFTDLSAYNLHWCVTDGETDFAAGDYTVQLAPGAEPDGAVTAYPSCTVIIPALAEAVHGLPADLRQELFVNLTFRRKVLPDWARLEQATPHGTIDSVISYAGVPVIDATVESETQLSLKACVPETAGTAGTIRVEEAGEELRISAGDTVWTLSRSCGLLTGCTRRGRVLLTAPMRPELYAVINEQLGPAMGQCRRADWQKAVLEMQLLSLKTNLAEPGFLLAEAELRLATTPESRLSVRYSFHGDGRVFLTADFDIADGLGTVPCIGWTTAVPKTCEHVKYLGKGPGESYGDRSHGVTVGAWETTPDAMRYPYLYPTESGNRMDCRWMTLTDDSGTGMLFYGTGTRVQCLASHHTAAQLASPKKWSRSYYELLEPEFRTEDVQVRVCLDVTGPGMGLATDYVSHTIASGRRYCFTIGVLPVSTGAAFPTVQQVTALTGNSPLPDHLIVGITRNGAAAEDFVPGQTSYEIPVSQADYQLLGDKAVPAAAWNLPANVTAETEEVPAEEANVIRKCRVTAHCCGAEERLTIIWRLVPEKHLSGLEAAVSVPALFRVNRSLTGEVLKSVQTRGMGPTLRTLQVPAMHGVSLAVGQTAGVQEAVYDISAYTAQGYDRLTCSIGLAPDQHRLDTRGFNIDFELANVQYQLLADGREAASGICRFGKNSRELDISLKGAKQLCIRVQLPREGYFLDTAVDLCELKLSRS